MAGDPNLARDIGELSGTLAALVPALERLETRMNAAEKAAAANDVEVAHMVKQFIAYRDQSALTIENFKRKAANEVGRQAQTTVAVKAVIQELKESINRIKETVEQIESRRAGFWSKGWDILKLLIAAALGIVGSRFFK